MRLYMCVGHTNNDILLSDRVAVVKLWVAMVIRWVVTSTALR